MEMSASSQRNVLIAGIPRSGTTLVCSLLNKLPDVVALHEPIDVWNFSKCRDSVELADAIKNFCAEARRTLREHGFAISKHVDGEIRDNAAADKIDSTGTRSRRTEHGKIEINKSLSENFTLAIKHPLAFTALVEPLSKHFECFAMVRNPLATLASWNSLDWLKVKKGHAPIAEQLDLNLARKLANESDTIERQIEILEWSYDRFHRFLGKAKVIKYEDLIATHARELSKVFPAATELDEDLVSKNLNKYYDRDLMTNLGQRLLRRDGPLWNFYSKNDVNCLLSEITSGVPAKS
jgi:sulfotransferase family protein